MKLKSLPLRYRVPLFLMLAMVTIVALFFAIENWRGARAWAEEREILKSQGFALTLEELLPPMPPSNQNFALTPIMRPLFPPDTNSSHEERVALSSTLGRPFTSILGRHPSPLRSGWREGRSTHVKFPPELMEKLGIDPITKDNVVTQILNAASSIAPELQQIEQGLALPYSQFPVEFDGFMANPLPQLSVMRSVSSAFALRGLARLETGDYAGGHEDTLTLLRAAKALERDPFLICLLVRRAQYYAALSMVWEGLYRRAWSDEQLQRIEIELATVDLPNHLLRSLKAEHAVSLQTIDQLLAGSNRPRAGMFLRNGEPASGWQTLLGAIPVPRGWPLQNKAAVSKFYRTQVLELASPEDDVFDSSKLEELDARAKRAIEQSGPHGALMGLLMPALSKAVGKVADAQSEIHLARTACALERYWFEHREYPETLEALTPTYMNRILIDPYSGETLRYRRENDRFILYSIGWNGTDDGGEIVLVNQTPAFVDRDQGDIVWRYPGPDTAESSPAPTR